MIALNIMRSSKEGLHSSCSCTCFDVYGTRGLCKAHLHVFKRLTTLWTSILCAKDDLSIWHKQDCLLGTFRNCGVKLLCFCPIELTCEQPVKWKRYGYKVVGTIVEGHPRKATILEYRETKPSELIDYLKPKLQAFVLHNYISSWQDFQFKELFTSVPSDTLISCVDFSENYTLKIQNEIQSMHWHNEQITILVHITYRLNPNWSWKMMSPCC